MNALSIELTVWGAYPKSNCMIIILLQHRNDSCNHTNYGSPTPLYFVFAAFQSCPLYLPISIPIPIQPLKSDAHVIRLHACQVVNLFKICKVISGSKTLQNVYAVIIMAISVIEKKEPPLNHQQRRNASENSSEFGPKQQQFNTWVINGITTAKDRERTNEKNQPNISLRINVQEYMCEYKMKYCLSPPALCRARSPFYSLNKYSFVCRTIRYTECENLVF